ncbi:MAG TPA: hypothetical protein VHI93_06785 [Candidatus Thermoplasmatota archaeon]|nr:hypothetical protein [Candidatus Thermoplasmatota archaeon]
MSPGDLALDPAGWLRALGGLVLLGLPGAAAADRWLAGVPLRFVWAPVLSLTLMPLAAMLLHFAVEVPVTPATTAAIAATLALALGWPRLRAAAGAAWRAVAA